MNGRLVGYLDGRSIFSDDPQIARIEENERFAVLPIGYRVPVTPPGTAATRKVQRLQARQKRALA